MTHTGAVPHINYQPQSTLLELPTPLGSNPISAFLPSDIPIGDSLALACRLALHYSEPQGQVPAMTNTPGAEVDICRERT